MVPVGEPKHLPAAPAQPAIFALVLTVETSQLVNVSTVVVDPDEPTPVTEITLSEEQRLFSNLQVDVRFR